MKVSPHDPLDVLEGRARWSVTQGHAPSLLATLPDACLDAIVSDPPYAEVDRDYGRMTEAEWHSLMEAVVLQARRVLKPTGSAVFVLQPNSEFVGRMRPWLFEFMAQWAREWNLVQDVWWWNTAAMPTIHTQREYGLLRQSAKACVWLGAPTCFRKQERVLWTESARNAAVRAEDRAENDALARRPSGHGVRTGRMTGASLERGGVTPFNVLPIANTNSVTSGGGNGHGAATPTALCDWWVRYLCPPGGLVCDPFVGSGTVGISAIEDGARFIGFEKEPAFVEMARARIGETAREHDRQPSLFMPGA